MIGIGGIRSVGQAQDQAASQTLSAYERPLSVNIMQKGRDWAARQQISYAAILGLLQKDFLSLADWSDQIVTYSQANTIQLSGPLGAILSKTRQNLLFRNRVLYDPALGATVGLELETVNGFATVFSAPEELVSDANALSGALGVK